MRNIRFIRNRSQNPWERATEPCGSAEQILNTTGLGHKNFISYLLMNIPYLEYYY